MLKPNQLYNTDCIKGLAKLAPESVDLAFADPPFNIGYDYDEYDDRKDAGDYLDWSRQWMAGVVTALKPTGAFWLAIGDEYAAELKIIATKDLGLVCRSWVIWYYTFGVHCKRKFTRSHAHLFHFVKDARKFTFNAAAISVPSARQLVYNDKRANPAGRMPDDTWILRPQDLPEGFQPSEDTWFFSRVCGTFNERKGWHGCQMPEQLLGRIIRACSNPGELVLDPFAGSGTTLAVAKKLGRKWLGFELSPSYSKQVANRLARIGSGDPIDGAEDPIRSAPQTPSELPRTDAVQERLRGRTRIRSSPAINRLNVSLGQIAVANRELATAIAEAYLAASDGYAIDRVLADPVLNLAFQQSCRGLGIPGSETECNRRLLGLRKAGRLSGLPKARKSTIASSELDQFIFASEIAWRILVDDHNVSLDDILCDPKLATEFDRIAGRFAPGWNPFQYRWGALTLRKDASEKRGYARDVPPAQLDPLFAKAKTMPLDSHRLPSTTGVYVIEARHTHLYVGETKDLRSRVDAHSRHEDALQLLLSRTDLANQKVELRVKPLDLSKWAREKRWGTQSRLLDRLKPVGNMIAKQAFDS